MQGDQAAVTHTVLETTESADSTPLHSSEVGRTPEAMEDLETWAVVAEADSRGGFNAHTFLTADERVVAVGDGAWRMYDADLNPLAQQSSAIGTVTLDRDNSLIYVPGPAATLRAYALHDGAFAHTVFTSSEGPISFAGRLGDYMFVASYLSPADEHSDDGSQLALLEAIVFDTPAKIDSGGVLESARGVEEWSWPMAMLPVTRAADGLLVAEPGRLVKVAPDASMTVVYEADFMPVALSPGADGTACLLADGEDGPTLRVLDLVGAERFSTRLPAGLEDAMMAPVIGSTGEVYVHGKHTVAAFDPRGNLKWRRDGTDVVVGMAYSTIDGLLVVTEREFATVDEAGNWTTLLAFKDDRLTAAPAVFDGGVLIASQSRVMLLGKTQR